MALGVNSRGGDMVRLVVGAVLGGLAQFVVGFIFWGTPLAGLAYRVAGEAENADLQAALARDLSPVGAGTFMVPWPDTANGTVLLGQGPVAMIHFSPTGVAPMDTGAIVGGLLMSVVTILLVGVALQAVSDRVHDFATRMKAALLIGGAGVLYFVLSMPVYNHYMPWAYWLFSAVSYYAAYAAGVFVLARWFLPRPSVAQQL